MEICRDEIFGPVISVLKFNDLEEAIGLANDTPYGLFGAVFSADQKKVHQVVTRVECGEIFVNTYFAQWYDAPFGGFKASGVGRELSEAGLENFLETKTVVYDCD